ncbi:MAG: MerR family transcriptional regulator, partial [Thermoanaerobaculales bacterium]|nr:MerR family transcriptional regulator [Thermoanaerobaculales bacterium]
MASDVAERNQQLWPMGAVTRRTGIGEHTLRAWERRFGFPKPIRLASGHRRFSGDQVQHLLLIAKALEAGYRAGDIVPLPLSELELLLRSSGVFDRASATGSTEDVMLLAFDACKRFDRQSLAALLHGEAAVLGLPRFLRERVAPLLDEVGAAWGRGEIEIRHEHFFSEVLEDELRRLRAPLEPATKGRPVVIASLPNELHGLGLQIAALAIVTAGRSVRVLGPHLPVEEIVQAATVLDAAAVGLSVSIFAESEETAREITAVRERLPAETGLWIGGAGSTNLEDLPAGVEKTVSLE